GEQRQAERRERKPGQAPAAGQAGVEGAPGPASFAFLVGDQVHVDGPGLGDGGHADAAGEQLGEAAAAAGPEDELGGVDDAGEVQQRFGDVVADDLVVGAADALDQGALAGQVGRVGAGQAVAARDVYGQQLRARG